MLYWYRNEGRHLNAVERSAMLHAVFVRPHPFVDGNGRTARLLLNLELMKDRYPSVVIKVESRLVYYQELDKAHTTQDYSDFISLVATEVEDSLDLYLRAIE